MTKKHKKTHEEEEVEAIEDGLKAIYGEEEVDFSTMERAPSQLTSILLTVIITLIVLAIGAGIAYFVYQKFFDIRQDEFLTLDIYAPETAISGELATIEINYKNSADVALTELEVDARLPRGFEIIAMTPMPDDINELVWLAGTLNGNSDATITIEGLWVAEAPSESPIQALATYRPGNFNSSFTEIETIYVDTLKSTLEMTFDGPTETYPGEEQEYTIHVKNDGTQDMNNILVDVELPDGFYLTSSNPPIDSGSSPEWRVQTLTPGAEQEIIVLGSFASDVDGFSYFNTSANLERDPVNLEQISIESFVDVLQNDIQLQLVAGGQTGDVSASLNEDLRFTISLENLGEVSMEDIDLLLDFQSQNPAPIVWSDATLDGGIIHSDGIHLSQDFLGPGEQILFNLTFPIDAEIAAGETDFFEVVASADLGDRNIKSSPISISISTDASFGATVRYYDPAGGVLGSGPIPPEVGETTTYRLFWTIDNQLHALRDIEMTTTLAPGVKWENQFTTDLGILSYDDATGIVSWHISELPLTLPSVEASIALSITPEAGDLGTFVKLISGSNFKAIDAETGDTLSRVTTSLSTDLTEDVFAEDLGAVVE
jgi:uncharacterized repeat protein (TIGR01451 family)